MACTELSLRTTISLPPKSILAGISKTSPAVSKKELEVALSRDERKKFEMGYIFRSYAVSKYLGYFK
jgi:hypothetical protein